MTRRVGDPVEVRVAGGPDAAPTSFLWRNRLYVVREVLGHWCERRDWWSGPAARAVHGDPVSAADGAVAVMGQEQELWRVEASPGRSFGSGVYDLSREAMSPVPDQGWRLVRVTD
jgi:Family of unknown function (DUF6504)